MKLIYTLSPFIFFILQQSPAIGQQSFQDHGMKIEWSFIQDSIIIKIKTPTKGWQAIGFNSSAELTGTYLIMTRITTQQIDIDEHYVISPGNYVSISNYGESQRARVVAGEKENGFTTIVFSLPQKASNQYQKDLKKGHTYTLHYAYSSSTDFGHHSTFRSKTEIIL
jgi:hypothetical protein